MRVRRNVALGLDVTSLILHHHVALVDDLERIDVACARFAHEKHTAVGALADRLDDLKVFDADYVAWRAAASLLSLATRSFSTLQN